MRLASLSLAVAFSACQAEVVAPVPGGIEIGVVGGWLPLAEANLEVSEPQVEVRNTGRRPRNVFTRVLSGDCTPPDPVELAGGLAVVLALTCGDRTGGFAFEVVSETDIARVNGEFPSRFDAGAPVPCAIKAESPNPFGIVDVGQSAKQTLFVSVLQGASCQIEVTTEHPRPFTATVVQSNDRGAELELEFRPEEYGQQWRETLHIDVVGAPRESRVITLEGSSATECPALHRGCATTQQGTTYLSTVDQLYRVENGLPQLVGAFVDVTGKPVFANDLAVQPDGTLLLLGPSVCVVDPRTAVTRSIFPNPFGGPWNSMDSLPDGRLVLGGDGILLVSLDAGIEQIIPAGTRLSGDLAVDAASQRIFATFASGANDDWLGVVDLTSKTTSILGTTGMPRVWGLTYSSVLTAFSADGFQAQLSTSTGAAIQLESFPGEWTGAALAR